MDRYEEFPYSSDGSPTISDRELLEWLASISPRHEAELQQLRWAEEEAAAEARRDRELLEWLASFSEKHEYELRELLRKEAEEQRLQERSWRSAENQVTQEEWVETDHPRRGYGPHPDAGVDKGEGGGSGSERDPSRNADGHRGDGPKSATPDMLNLAHAWWQTARLLQRARRNIEDLPKRIAHERAQFGSGGRYAHLHNQYADEAERDLEAAKTLALQLEKQLHDLEQQYHDSGYDEIEHHEWTRDETQVGGRGIADVGRAIARRGESDGVERTGDEAYIAQAAMGVFQFGKAALEKGLEIAARKLEARVEAFVAKLPRKLTPTSTAASRYETKHAGPYNYTVSGGGAKFDIDGYRGSTILEAKLAGNPKSSPYVPGSSCPDKVRNDILNRARKQLKSIRTIIKSGETPFTSVEIITNSPESKRLFEGLLKESHVSGTVRLEP